MASQTGTAGLLVVGSASTLLAVVFGILRWTLEDDIQLMATAVALLAATLAVGCALAYALFSRHALATGRLTRFERALHLRNFALNAVPVGVVSVVVALLWYVVWRVQDLPESSVPVYRVGILAFAGLGTLFVWIMLGFAIAFERRAIRVAREDVAKAGAS